MLADVGSFRSRVVVELGDSVSCMGMLQALDVLPNGTAWFVGSRVPEPAVVVVTAPQAPAIAPAAAPQPTCARRGAVQAQWLGDALDGSRIDLGAVGAIALAPDTSAWLNAQDPCHLVLRLDRGRVFVHAADLAGGELRVATASGDVLVHGTRFAVQHGADAIVVSNHGGRQLDGARSTISALPGVVDAVAGGCEVLFDGGVRTGQDVLKALALGARGCLIGKAFLYSLAARGEAGVTLALDIIRKELAVSLALTGANDVSKVTRDILIPRS